MKNYIDVYDENNNLLKMEVVSMFKLDGYSFNYIIYCSLDHRRYYVAKYMGDNIVDLDTNLSQNELDLCNKVFKEVKKAC